MQKVFLGILLTCMLLCGGGAMAQVFQPLITLLQDPAIQGAQFSIHVVNLEKDSTVLQYRSNETMVPASVLKLFTSAAALETFGGDHQFSTGIGYTGTLDEHGVLHGDLILRGGGDPTLGSRYFGQNYGLEIQTFNDWADSVKKAGIKKIEGAIVADASIFPDRVTPSTWIWGDMGNYFGASPTGIAVYDNACELIFKSGNPGTRTNLKKIRPAVPGLTYDNRVMAKAINSDQAYVYGAPYEFVRYAEGAIPANRTSFVVKGSQPDPALFSAIILHKALKNQGILLLGEPTTHRLQYLDGKMKQKEWTEIHSHKSPPLAEIVKFVNLKSVNLFAEHLAMHLALKMKMGKDVDNCGPAVRKFWESKMDGQTMFLHDGSGLSRFSGISTSQLTTVLATMAKSEEKKAFVGSLPIMGRTGSLAAMGKGTAAADNLRAKSGYMSRVRSYAGYFKSTSGEKMAFAIIVNNYSCSASAMKKKLEKLMVALPGLP